jgi:Ser/Thr protein kinase RdoA (MazF antagonist)
MQILGYRKLDETEIEAINALKELEALTLHVVDMLKKEQPELDARWIAIGKTNLEQAYMAFARAIARPEPVKVDIEAIAA